MLLASAHHASNPLILILIVSIVWLTCWNVVRRQGGVLHSLRTVYHMGKEVDRALLFTPVEAGGVPLYAVVRVEGKVQAGPAGTLISPQGKQGCVWWGQKAKGRKFSDSSTEMFWIQDLRGTIGVKPEGMFIEPSKIDLSQVPDENKAGVAFRALSQDDWVLLEGTQVSGLAPVGQDQDGNRFLQALPGQPSDIINGIGPEAFRRSRNGRLLPIAGILGIPLIFMLLLAGSFS